MDRQLKRRKFVVLAGGAVAGTLAVRQLALLDLTSPAQAQERNWLHGASLFADLKYPAGFNQFEYVNASAPKGGIVRQAVLGTFNNFNMVVAGVKGSLATGIDLIYETLLEAAEDEVSSAYGLLAEAVSYAADYSSVSFRLRSDVKWHDGVPITADDVIFSFEAFKKFSPQQSARYRRVAKIKKTGDREITFISDQPGSRSLPRVLGQLTVLPKHWWASTDANGKNRDIGATTTEAPLGSGAYRIKDFAIGRFIAFERVSDYWGRTINVNVGRNNFDQLRYEYFRDPAVAIAAFRANTIDWRTENNARNWTTAYRFAAVQDKRVLLEEFPIRDVGMMQGFAFNTRRKKFQDPRVRLAFNYAFDFDRLNRQIFHGQYKRIDSYFEGTELAANGLPAGRELELLESVRDKVPAEVFTKAYSNPIFNTPDAARNNLRHAIGLLREAGYEVRDRQLVDAYTNEPYVVEFLTGDRSFERVILLYKASLDRLGMKVTVRTVDPAQYENRLRSWDFDVITSAWSTSLSPGEEQRDYWGSQTADQPGSLNLIGIKNPGVDAMINQIVWQRTERIWKPPLRHSTVCCSGIITSCRNGFKAKCAPLDGIDLGIPT